MLPQGQDYSRLTDGNRTVFSGGFYMKYYTHITKIEKSTAPKISYDY